MSSRGRGHGQVKRTDTLWWQRACALPGLIAVSLLISGCAVSTISNPFRSGKEDTAASAVNEDRLMETAKADAATDLPDGKAYYEYAREGITLKL